MAPKEKSVIETLEEASNPPTNPPTNPSTGSRRRGPLRSRTADTFFRILSFCNEHNLTSNPDSGKDGTHIGSVTKNDVPLACTNVTPNDSLCQGETSMDETRMALGTQGGLYDKHVESTEGDDNKHVESTEGDDNKHVESTEGDDNKHVESTEGDDNKHVESTEGDDNKHVESTEGDDNIPGERKDLSYTVDADPSNFFDMEDLDNYDIDFGDDDSFPMIPISVTDMMISSPHLPTDKDVEEGEISGEFMDFMPEDDMSSVDKTSSEPQDVIGIEPGHLNDNNLIPSVTDTVDDVGKDMVAVASKTRRNLVDYSEIAVNGKSIQAARPERLHARLETAESTKLGIAAIESGCAPYDDAQNIKKRQGSCTGDDRTNKNVKKSVDATTCPENRTWHGEHPEDASKEVVDASANMDDAADEKKKKRVLTKERKAKKKRKDRIKRAEKNRKLGVKRLKIQPFIKEKKITYCRHYLKGRCHEGEKCKFSHDTVPLTKSKPCCHFARHACMKGDDCPFDHELSKYPCNNFISKGFCSRGSDCMFSHEAQPSEAAVNASNESKPEGKPSSLLDNSGSKKHNNIDVSSREKIDKKSCSTPMSVTKNTERNLVEPTPKPSIRPPKGISFLSQEKPPLESCKSPKVVAVADVVQDSKEITKKPLVIPRGINFLSFGKKPDSDGGFSFKMGTGIGKSPLSKVDGESAKSGSTVNVDAGVKANAEIGNNNNNNNNNKQMNSQRPMLMQPFMSSSSERVLHSTLDFANKFESGVKEKGPEI